MNAHRPAPRPLPMLAVLRVAGRDAASFLQGQLTHDVRLLADGRTQLAACNTPQGRVVALLRLSQSGEAIHALLPAELAEPLVARLRRFVLRARVELEVARDLDVAWLEAADAPAMPGDFLNFDYAPGRRVAAATGEAWRAAQGRGLEESRAATEEWLAADIADGLPQVFAATSEAFVPQMLNLDLIDGISFKKGCYTGQEIVARTQHLGRIKRRAFRYRLPPGPVPAPLTALFLRGAKVAEVVMGVTVGDGVELLAVTSLEARDQLLELADGRSAEPRAVPYVIPAAGAETAARPGSTASS